MKVLKQAESDMVQIDANIADIVGRLDELGEQREEYKLYQQLERTQRFVIILVFAPTKSEKKLFRLGAVIYYVMLSISLCASKTSCDQHI